MRVKRLAGGGESAFVSYININLPLPSIGTTSLSAALRATTSEESGELIDKDMRKLLFEKGLPSDVQYFIQTSDAFNMMGYTDNPYIKSRMYKQLLAILPEIRLNKEEYDEAVKHAREKGTLQEFAVASDGSVYVSDKEGNVTLRDPFKLEEGDHMLTNGYLAQMRAYYTGKAFDKGSLTTTIASSESISDIIKIINDFANKIGSLSVTNDSFVRKSGNLSKVQKGLEKMLEEAEPGVYKLTEKSISKDSNVTAAVNYLLALLTPQLMGILKVNAVKLGLDSTEGIKLFVTMALRSLIDTTKEKSLQYQHDMSVEAGLTRKKSELDKLYLGTIDSTPASDFFRGLGKLESFVMRNGNGVLYLLGNIGSVSNSNGVGLGTVTLDKINETEFAPGLDMSQASFGGVNIDITKQQNIVVDSNKIVGLDLPIDVQAALMGIIKPDFNLLEKVGKIQNLIKLSGETDPDKINLLYVAAGLPEIYKGTDNNGNLILNPQYYRFAALDAYADANILPTDIIFDKTVEKVEDETVLNSIYSILKQNKGYKPAKSGFLFWTDPELYKGTVFIPIRNHAVNYMASTKHTLALSSAMQLAEYNKLKQHNDLGITLNY